MVRVSRNALRWTLATVTLLGARSVSADPINFTGSVEKDFDPAADKNVKVIQVNADPFNSIYQLPQMTSQGIVNGYAIKDIRLKYDFDKDVLSVGVNSYSIAGSAIGNGGPDIAKALADFGGVDPAHIGGNKSITVAFAGKNLNDLNQHGPIVALAGVPSDKATAGPGLIGFNVANYDSTKGGGIQNSYGTTLSNNLGALAFDPSADHPDFEFTIKNFSKISPDLLDPKDGFWLQAYAGSPDDNPIGEESTPFIKIPAFSPEVIPEPTTWLAWSVITASLGALKLRGRSRKD